MFERQQSLKAETLNSKEIKRVLPQCNNLGSFPITAGLIQSESAVAAKNSTPPIHLRAGSVFRVQRCRPLRVPKKEKKKAAGCGKKLEIESTWEECNPPSRRGGQSRKLMTRPEDVNAQEHNRAWRDVSHVGAQFGLVHQFIKQTGYILKIKTCNHFGTGELNRKWQEWRILGG